MMKDAKYLLAYIAPLSAIWGIYMGGLWTFSTFMIAYVIIPSLELISIKSTSNFSEEEEHERLKSLFFDALLYLNVPLLYGILWYYFSSVSTGVYAPYEIVGLTASIAIILTSMGINVGHELGHRKTWYEQTMSKLLYLPCLYMHFFIEHNKGHHKNVATDEDPASARKGEIVYFFWIRSVIGGYLSAWNIENSRLRRKKQAVWGFRNQMIHYHIIQALYLLGIYTFFGGTVLTLSIIASTASFLLLETINYIEHYGLRRKKLPSGQYERVLPRHSWNSNHEVGRIFLYELTRHSDHHYKSTRKYQILRHFDDAPQLPYGYPGSMLLAFIPPLWFRVMDKEVQAAEVAFG